MKQIFTNENRILAFNTKNLLESAGISVETRNEFTAGSAVPGHQIWLELWVKDAEYEKSKSILSALEDAEEEWVCVSCGEENGSAFEVCWSCQNAYT
ncbi:DUF2007 domain-containing protein [Paraglaciecola sp.]|uniref:putative signal transducing protein n=1 Tax=Paraglaciecola sp. TaxID=1920173 RepID=UPI0030F389E4